MRKCCIQIFSILVFLMCFSVIVVAQTADQKAPAGEEKKVEFVFKNNPEKWGYCVGYNIGLSMKQRMVDIDSAMLAKGLQDALKGLDPIVSKEEIQKGLLSLQEDMSSKETKRQTELSEKNKKEGDVFLAENKTKEGVQTLPNGIQYKVLKTGAGDNPKETDTVKVHYAGRLLNGTEFDNSYTRNEPLSIKVNGVIEGWKEILKLMKPGDKWTAVIPPELAYGDNGAGQVIPPKAVLIFDMELVSIEKPEAPKPEGTPSVQPEKK